MTIHDTDTSSASAARAAVDKKMREIDDFLNDTASFLAALPRRRDAAPASGLVATVQPLRPAPPKADITSHLKQELLKGNDVHSAVVNMDSGALDKILYKNTAGNMEEGDVHRVSRDYANAKNAMGHTPLEVAGMAKEIAARIGDARAQRRAERMMHTLERYLMPRMQKIRA